MLLSSKIIHMPYCECLYFFFLNYQMDGAVLVELKAQKILDFDYSTAMIWLLKVSHRPHLQQFYLGMTFFKKKTHTKHQKTNRWCFTGGQLFTVK